MAKAPQDTESRHADKYIVRFPEGMRDRIAAAAKASGRTMNAEITARLQRSLEGGAEVDVVIDQAQQIAEQRKLVALLALNASAMHGELERLGFSNASQMTHWQRLIDAGMPALDYFMQHDFKRAPETRPRKRVTTRE